VVALAPSDAHLATRMPCRRNLPFATGPSRRGHIGIAVAVQAFVNITAAGSEATVGSRIADRSSHSLHAGETVIAHSVVEPHTIIACASCMAAALRAAPAIIPVRHDEEAGDEVNQPPGPGTVSEINTCTCFRLTQRRTRTATSNDKSKQQVRKRT